MQVYVESFMIVVLEMLCCRFFFEIFANTRDRMNFLKRQGIFWGLVLSVYLIAGFLSDHMLIKVVLVILMIAVWMKCFLEIHFWKSVLLSLIFEALLLLADSFTYVLCVSFLSGVLHVNLNDHMLGTLLVILGKMLLFCLLLILRKNIVQGIKTTQRKALWLRFVFFPVFTIGAILTMLITLGDLQDQNLEMVFFVLAFGLTGMNIIMFYLMNDIIKCEMEIRENQLYALEARNQTNMYRTISEGFIEQRKKTHEYKNQIFCIEALLKKQKYDELAEYVRGLGEHLTLEHDYISTNHVIVDAILNAKYHEMISKNILFVFHINDLSKIGIEDEDLVVILSNLLNNAIEACEKCSGKKIIKMKFIKENQIVLSVKNTYDTSQAPPRKTSGDKALEEHGYGIRNIIEAVNKYHGVYSIRTGKEEFYFSIMIPSDKA